MSMEIEPAAASITSETESIQKPAVIETASGSETKLVNGNCASNSVLDQKSESSEGKIDKNENSEKEQNDPIENGDDRDRSRSSSPEIIHIKTIAAPPKQHRPQKSEEELKRLFEIEYLEKVLFKIHALLIESKESKPETETESKTEKNQSEAQNGEIAPSTSAANGDSSNHEEKEKLVSDRAEKISESDKKLVETLTSDEPEAKRVKFSLNDDAKSDKSKATNEDDDDEITTVRTIQASVVPGFSAELESKFCDLWDLSSQAQVAQFMYEKSCYNPLKDIILKTSASFREIALGILSNLSSIRDVCEKCYQDLELLEKLYSFFEATAPKPDIQNQTLKLFSFCLQHDEEKWSKLINEKKIIPKSFEFLCTEKPYIIEKIMENMGYIFDVSESLSFVNFESSEPNLVDVICKALKCYGINSKEDRCVETIGNLLSVLSYLESNSETTSQVHSKSEAIFDIIQHVLSCIDEKQFTFSYTSCIERALKLSLKLLSRIETAEKQLEYFKKYSEFNMCWIEFLEFFEQEVEENEYNTIDQFSMQNIYLALTECYNLSKFFEKLKDEIGEAKFFEGVAEDLREMLSSTFETYSSKMAAENSENDESDNDIVEITSTETNSQVSATTSQVKSTKTEEQLVAISENGDAKLKSKSETTAENCNEAQNLASNDTSLPESGKDNSEQPNSTSKDNPDQNVSSEIAKTTNSDEAQSVQLEKETNSVELNDNRENEPDNGNVDDALEPESKEVNPGDDADESIPDLSDTDL